MLIRNSGNCLQGCTMSEPRRPQFYEDPSIIFGTDAAILSKTNFESTDHHQPRSRPIP
jgi:hypothetical protein